MAAVSVFPSRAGQRCTGPLTVLHPDGKNRKLQHRIGRVVVRLELVPHVAVDKELARPLVQQHALGHARVAAPEPEVLRRLAFGALLEEARMLLLEPGGPLLVGREERVASSGHGGGEGVRKRPDPERRGTGSERSEERSAGSGGATGEQVYGFVLL